MSNEISEKCVNWHIILVRNSEATSGLRDNVVTWKRFPHYWPFVRGFHQSSVDSPTKNLDDSFNVSIDKLFNKQSSCRWFETPWRHCNAFPPKQHISHHAHLSNNKRKKMNHMLQKCTVTPHTFAGHDKQIKATSIKQKVSCEWLCYHNTRIYLSSEVSRHSKHWS